MAQFYPKIESGDVTVMGDMCSNIKGKKKKKKKKKKLKMEFTKFDCDEGICLVI